MPPSGGYHPRTHDDTAIAEIQAAIDDMNSTISARPNSETLAAMEASLANLSSVLTLLGQRTQSMEARMNDSLADDDTKLTYTRWGRTECPEDTGAVLVYAGEYNFM